MNDHQPQPRVMREITLEWDRLMRFAAQLDYGEARVVFQNGKPTRIDSAIKQIKLDSEQDFREGLKTVPLL